MPRVTYEMTRGTTPARDDMKMWAIMYVTLLFDEWLYKQAERYNQWRLRKVSARSQ